MSDEPERIILDQMILTFRIPKSLPDEDAVAARSVLASATFLQVVTRAIVQVLADEPILAAVTVDVSP